MEDRLFLIMLTAWGEFQKLFFIHQKNAAVIRFPNV
jgi:hypothetical protein